MNRFLTALPLVALLLPATAFAMSDSGDGGEETPYYNPEIELQDIFVPDRLIEIAPLPDGTEVINEVFIHNAGDQDLEINEISLNYQSDENWVLVEESIPAENLDEETGYLIVPAHEFITVEVKYTSVEGIDTFAALDIYSDDPDEAVKTVAFIGESETFGPDARVSETIIDFGFRYTGTDHTEMDEFRLADADARERMQRDQVLAEANRPLRSLGAGALHRVVEAGSLELRQRQLSNVLLEMLHRRVAEAPAVVLADHAGQAPQRGAEERDARGNRGRHQGVAPGLVGSKVASDAERNGAFVDRTGAWLPALPWSGNRSDLSRAGLTGRPPAKAPR